MKKQPTRPTGHAQTFGVEETFFSTTDERGVITAGNQVFCRTSGYTFEEMTGQPHNLIRHPDMPRLVFRQLWETIRAGRSFMGYVKNHARNGNHYWVFAIVVPLPTGYLSVRIKPTSPLFAKIEALYRTLIEVETRAIAGGASESQAADAAREPLAEAVRQLGFATYQALSHHALNTEIKSRDAEIAARGLRLFPDTLPGTAPDDDADTRMLFQRARSVYEGINALFSSLDAFVALCRDIEQRKNAVQAISENFRLNALNAQLAATPLGADGVTLGTVAMILNTHGHTLSKNTTVLADNILATTRAVEDIASNLSAARIQIEMLLTFLAEIAAGHDAAVERHKLRAMADDLRTGFATTAERAFGAVDALVRDLPAVLNTKQQLRKDIIYLQVAQISGLTEVSRVSHADSLQATFMGLRGQIESGKRELEQLDRVVDELKKLTASTPPKVQVIRKAMALDARAADAGSPDAPSTPPRQPETPPRMAGAAPEPEIRRSDAARAPRVVERVRLSAAG